MLVVSNTRRDQLRQNTSTVTMRQCIRALDTKKVQDYITTSRTLNKLIINNETLNKKDDNESSSKKREHIDHLLKTTCLSLHLKNKYEICNSGIPS